MMIWERDLFNEYCKRIDVPPDIVRQLIELEQDQVGRVRRRGLHDRIEDIIAPIVQVNEVKNVLEVDPAA
jgi:hypothetical protein